MPQVLLLIENSNNWKENTNRNWWGWPAKSKCLLSPKNYSVRTFPALSWSETPGSDVQKTAVFVDLFISKLLPNNRGCHSFSHELFLILTRPFSVSLLCQNPQSVCFSSSATLVIVVMQPCSISAKHRKMRNQRRSIIQNHRLFLIAGQFTIYHNFAQPSFRVCVCQHFITHETIHCRARL